MVVDSAELTLVEDGSVQTAFRETHGEEWVEVSRRAAKRLRLGMPKHTHRDEAPIVEAGDVARRCQ